MKVSTLSAPTHMGRLSVFVKRDSEPMDLAAQVHLH